MAQRKSRCFHAGSVSKFDKCGAARADIDADYLRIAIRKDSESGGAFGVREESVCKHVRNCLRESPVSAFTFDQSVLRR